jgi:hypothetical protein
MAVIYLFGLFFFLSFFGGKGGGLYHEFRCVAVRQKDANCP